MNTVIAEFPLACENDVRPAAQRARLLATLVNLSDRQRKEFGTAVREIAANALLYGNGGRVVFSVTVSDDTLYVDASIFDSADGRERIAEILEQPPGSDSGLHRARNAVDELTVESCETGGKFVRARMLVSPMLTDLHQSDIAEWAGVLRTRRTQSALAANQRRTREMAEQLSRLQRHRQELETELQDSRSLNETLTLLSLVAGKTDNAVIIMDENGLTTWVNDAFIRMTGYSLQDSEGSRPDNLLTGPETARESLEELEHAFHLGHGLTEEFLQYRRGGATGWISLSLTPVHDANGQVIRWIGIGADITERRDAQMTLERARDAAEKASQLKGDFLANISHEIRTPMNAIIGMTDLALGTPLDEEQHDYLSTVKRSAEALLDLLNDVLDLSRIESGRMEIDSRPFRLRVLMQETLRPLGVVAEQKEIQLSWSLAEDIPEWLAGDAMRLRQILTNLAGNAVKFTQTGFVDVMVVRQADAPGNADLLFTVADTGIGIPPDKLDRIFEAFTQADTSVTRQYGGTGLGLAITSELVRLMDGRIWVQSEPSRGSKFHFTVPMRLQADSEIPDDDPQTAKLTPLPQTTIRPLDILVADDHPANRQLIARILERRGHQPVFANDGRDAVHRFREHHFDIVLMDVQMPEMDGYQATAAIREFERETQSHVPIIAVTAHAMPEERDACLAAGMDAWLTKPISAVELVTLVDGLGENQINISAPSATGTGFVPVDQASARPAESRNADSLSVEAPCEFQNALKRLDNDPELLREQMHFFLTDAPRLMDMLLNAAQKNDIGPRKIAAHRLKNLCATFDDETAAAMCHHIEMLNDDCPAEQVLSRADDLRKRIHELLAEIRAFCGN